MRFRWREAAARAAVVGCYFAVWSAVYSFTNAYASDPARTIHFVRPCDLAPDIIQPWTAFIYVFGGMVLPLLPFFYNWRWSKLWFVLACYVLSSAVAFVCYCVWPLGIVRPSFEGPGPGQWLMRQVVSIDQEANCFPSSHVYYALLGAILVWHGGASRLVRGATCLLAAAVCATTVTTGQHYVLDVAGGAAVAAASYVAVRFLLPDRGAPAPRKADCGRGSSARERAFSDDRPPSALPPAERRKDVPQRRSPTGDQAQPEVR